MGPGLRRDDSVEVLRTSESVHEGGFPSRWVTFFSSWPGLTMEEMFNAIVAGRRDRAYPAPRASISSSVGNRPVCFFEKASLPSTVISNTPPTPGTNSTSAP